MASISPAFEGSWPWDLLWPIEYGENNNVPVLRLEVMGPFLVSFDVLGPFFQHVDKPRLACWRMRKQVE